jgi:hypothetical protein
VLAFWDARYDIPLPLQNILRGRLGSNLNIDGAAVITPGDPGRSMIYLRASGLGDHQMPPLARNVVDTNALTALAQWIKTMSR